MEVVFGNISDCCLLPVWKLFPLRIPATSTSGARGGGDGEDVAELEMGDIDLSRYTEDVTITVFGAFGGSDTAVATGFVVIDGSFVVVAAPFPTS